MTDFQKANQAYNATLSGNYTVGDTVLSVSSVPANVPTIVTVARDTVKETRFYVTGIGTNQLTGVSRLDGANVNIASGSSVECMNDAEFINQLSAAVFAQTGLKGLVYAADGGSTDAYEISLPVAPTALSDILGLPIAFKANTANTGAATLAVNGLAATAIKKSVSTALDTGDILANQIVIVAYDGTNFQMVGHIPATVDLSSYATKTGAETLTNKRVTKRVASQTSTGTITPDSDLYDGFDITALAVTGAFQAPSGTPTDMQTMVIRIKDNGTARALTWASGTGGYVAGGVSLPANSVTGKYLHLGFMYVTANSLNKWMCLASAQEA